MSGVCFDVNIRANVRHVILWTYLSSKPKSLVERINKMVHQNSDIPLVKTDFANDPLRV